MKIRLFLLPSGFLKKIAFLLLVLSISQNPIYSQKISSKISCKVVDATTKKPVVYATIMLKEIQRGTHADFNGNFEIPIKYYQNSSIQISSIGYQTKNLKLSTLLQNKVNTIYLSKSFDKLDEIVVTTKRKKKKLYARQIVRKAIQNILENYPTSPHSYIGYYRDYQQPVGNSYQKHINAKEKIEYVNVNEAIIESFDNGYKTDKLKSKKNQTILYSYQSNPNFIQDSTLTVPYDNRSKKFSESVYITPLGGNELNLLDLTNAIRNHDKMSFSFTNVFNKDFIRNHFFKLKEMVYSDKIALYKISFSSLKEKTSYQYAAFGEIYISKNDFAIYKLNYNLYYRKKKNPQYSVTIEFSPKKDKMYLNYISFNNFFEATNGNYFKIDKTSFRPKTNEFVISFNRQVDIASIEPFRKNFKVYYKNKKLKVIDVHPSSENQRTFILHIDKTSLKKINFEEEKNNPDYGNYFQFEIENIYDLNGFEINKRPSLKMNQYREFFVQEVFKNKRLPVQKGFIDKSKPLSKSKVTPLMLENKYWINTPLKSEKK